MTVETFGFNAPCNGQLRRGCTQVRRKLAQLHYLGIARGVDQIILHPRHVLSAPPFGNSVYAHFPVSKTRREWTPWWCQPDFRVEPRVLVLHTLSFEQVVFRLLHHRLVQMMFVGDLPRTHDVGRAPFRRTHSAFPGRRCRAS